MRQDALQVLAAGLRRDLDLAFERILAHRAQLGVAALEQRLEDIGGSGASTCTNVSTNSWLAVTLIFSIASSSCERALRQILALLSEELPTLLLLAVFLERQ